MKTDRDFAAEIQAQLDTLGHLPSRRWQRDKTILALAAAAVDGTAVNSVFGQNGVISKPTYYRRGGCWHDDPDFKRVLTAVTSLKREQDAAIRAQADEKARRERHEKRAKLLETAVEKLETMLDGMVTDEQPPAVVATYLKTVLSEERAEFGDTEPVVIADVPAYEKSEEVRRNLMAKLAAYRKQVGAATSPDGEADTEPDPKDTKN